ncbi:VIT and VWA domain-containing protein [Desulfococcaceae bacterium HSG7]|nr:VIT and VWA domain-containing protein [Desulfococcaceae bacterium HSG7]
MSKKMLLSVMVALVACLIFNPQADARRDSETGDKTLAPYFLVKSDDPETDRLPLKATSAEVNIAGVIADITVTQVYKNEGQKALEAIYVFPASTKAAVYGMKMTIGERTIHAKIKKKEEARQDYERAKKAGQSASLLEQHRPNVFQMNVANILPEDVIKVELKYTELLIPTDAVYEFVYPTVVGPRYAGDQKGGDAPSEDWVANPYLHEDEKPLNTFDIGVHIRAGLPIRGITCETHKTNINYEGKNIAAVQLDSSEKQGGNRDFILKYRLAGDKIETGMLLYQGEKENFFLLMMQPHRRVKVSQIPPREYLFVVDVSGSMRGFPLNTSKTLLKNLIGSLKKEDQFNVLLFAGSATVMSEHSLPATQANINRAVQTIDKRRGGGGTRLLPALERVFDIPKAQGYSRTIVIVTDGYVAVEARTFDLIRNRLGDANIFPFGIGRSVNRHLIEGMARMGMGEPFVVINQGNAQAKADKFRKLIQTPVLTGVKVDYNGFDAYDVEPPAIPDVLAERPVIVFGKYRGKPEGSIRLLGVSGETQYSTEIDLGMLKPSAGNVALRYLWARHRIAVLADYNRLRPDDGRIKEVTDLGLNYNLLTAYTSFIAVDSLKRLKEGQATTVKQPLPLPQGVADTAVGIRGIMAAPKAKGGDSKRRKMAYLKPLSSERRYQKAYGAMKSIAPKTERSKKKPVQSSRSTDENVREYAKAPEPNAIASVEQKRDKTEIATPTPTVIPAKDKSAESEAAIKPCIKIGSITVTGNITKADVRKQLEALLDDIGKCYQKSFGDCSQWPQTVIATMVIGSQGVGVNFKAAGVKTTVKGFYKCMEPLFRKIKLTPSDQKGVVKIVVTFVLQK